MPFHEIELQIKKNSGYIYSMLRKLRIAVLILAVIYFLTSLSIAYGFSMPGHTISEASPVDYGAVYEDVSFYSSIDHVLLSGWYISGGGSTTIVVMHGGRAKPG